MQRPAEALVFLLSGRLHTATAPSALTGHDRVRHSGPLADERCNLADHQTRIRALDRRAWTASGAATVNGAGADVPVQALSGPGTTVYLRDAERPRVPIRTAPLGERRYPFGCAVTAGGRETRRLVTGRPAARSTTARPPRHRRPAPWQVSGTSERCDPGEVCR
jgi:hypothetical protein